MRFTMAEDNGARLRELIGDEQCKRLLEFCIEPREWKEIQKLKIKSHKIFGLMKELKTIKALEFADGKYFSADFVKEYL